MRESLIIPAQEGLVQVLPKIGSLVSRVDPAQVADAQFLREAVELASLEDLPEQLDAAVVEELQDNLKRRRRADLDLEEFFATHSPEPFATDASAVPVRRNVVVRE